jgi:hypothetical protein
MKLEGRTLSILKNFASINPSIQFKPGDVLKTVSPNKTILAHAKLGEQVEGQFAIFDLSKFLSVMSLFDKPTLKVEEKYMTISDGQQRVNYTFADPRAIALPPEKTPQVANPEIEFKLTTATLDRVQKAMGILKMPEIAIVGNGTDITVEAVDSKNPSADTFAIKVGSTKHTFKMVFKSENIKIIAADYDVTISSKGIGNFKCEDIEYWIVAEASSTFKAGE